MKALVTDAHLRSVLAGIRGLGRGGHEVVALGPRRSDAGLWSRYVDGRAVAPGAASLAARIAEIAAEHGTLVVYPGQESAIDALLAAPLPQHVTLPYPDVEALAVLRDKRRLATIAADAGLAAPATLVEATAGELSSWSTSGPCVVKPARPQGALPTTRVAESAEELHALVAVLPDDEPLLVQERARGPLASLALVVDRDGRAVARFQQVARRTWPPDAGISAVAESVPLDDRLADRATAMLAATGFAGLAQLQFVEEESGLALIDVNPRFYGSLPLALACGVNLPAAWHATVTGASPPPADGYRVGVTFHWLEGDLLNALLTGRRPLPHLIRRFLRPPPRPRTGAVWSGDDPLPAVLFGTGLIMDIVGRRMRRWSAAGVCRGHFT